jgi:TonB family protein
MLRQCMAALMLLAVCSFGHAVASEDVINPSLVHAPIQYPESAITANEEGTVLVRALVEPSGHAVSLSIDKSSGHADLDAAALQSISQWSFSPGIRNGKPEPRWVVLPVSFQRQAEPESEAEMHNDMLAIIRGLAGTLGALILFVCFVWSVVLAKRISILWLSFMVALWAITYPLFVATHWSLAKRSLPMVAAGLALVALSLYLAPVHPLPS